jgi:hypothetical protein
MVVHPSRGVTDDGQAAVLESVGAGGIKGAERSPIELCDFPGHQRMRRAQFLKTLSTANWLEPTPGDCIYINVAGRQEGLGHENR